MNAGYLRIVSRSYTKDFVTHLREGTSSKYLAKI